MSVKPSNQTVIRFVALFDNGFEKRLTRIVLGHGYKEYGGLSHSYLSEIYELIDLETEDIKSLYAGYLCLENDTVKVFSGGSESMGISQHVDKNESVASSLKTLSGLAGAIAVVFPHIISGKIMHTMFFQQ